MEQRWTMVLTAIAVILISCSSIQANSAAFETDPFHQPDFRIGVGVGTDGPFIFVGIDRAYQYSNFSLEPLGTVIGKTFELGQDFFQESMEVYEYQEDGWTDEAVYTSDFPPYRFMGTRNNRVILMVHGLFTGEHLEWTEAADLIRSRDSNVEIYAVDYGTGYHLEHLGRILAQIIADCVKEGTEVSIIAHSQGGLISRTALELYNTGRTNVRRLITLATPHLGVYYGTAAVKAADGLIKMIPEISDLMSESEFLETLNSSIKYLDVEYYFAAGIERQVFAPFWDIANQFASIDLSQIVNDGVVERRSALGSGLRFQQYRPVFETTEFAVNHTSIMSDEAVLQQVWDWLY